MNKKKVIGYFYRTKNGEKEILVFDHLDMPEAGTQVIGGTVEEGEGLKSALVREVLEESGIVIKESDLQLLAETIYHRKDRNEINERTYFMIDGSRLKDNFTHKVISDGEDSGLIFVYYWLSFEKAKEILTGNFGECLNLI
jgi:8-oxo-dGTP pyrophosphatase MutT (NUDIX family)